MKEKYIRISDSIACKTFPCKDIQHDFYLVPDVDVEPDKIQMVVISEAVPENPQESYYAGEDASYAQTTLQAFNQAGVGVNSFKALTNMGIYFTPAVKCAKTAYSIKAATINHCSYLLEAELSLFPNLKVILLMGDVAIKALNAIARRITGVRTIPAGSTYKIREGTFTFKDMRVFPSYLQVGPSVGIEKSKQIMIAEDISAAMACLSDF